MVVTRTSEASEGECSVVAQLVEGGQVGGVDQDVPVAQGDQFCPQHQDPVVLALQPSDDAFP